MSWAAKYRPRIFEDVQGQARATEALRSYVTNPAPCSVVLHGHTGAGKTTLARIYAQARLCEAPRASGSPCLSCSACTLVEQGRQDEIRFYSPAMQNAEELQRIVNEIQLFGPLMAKQRVFIFDEAAKLGTRLETLYAELEAPRHGTTFIFTLLDLAALPEPARDRLIKVQLADADPHANVENLTRICELEQASYEVAALELLAEVSGSYRRSVESLQAVALRGPVDALTLAGVIRAVPRGKLRAYTERDLRTFLTEPHERRWPSTDRRRAATSTTISNTRVVAFTARQARKAAAKRKP